MADEREWFVDTEGNLTSGEGDGVKPPTDEFGRDDPESLERERRRREREARRSKSRKARPEKAPEQQQPPEPEQPRRRSSLRNAARPPRRSSDPSAQGPQTGEVRGAGRGTPGRRAAAAPPLLRGRFGGGGGGEPGAPRRRIFSGPRQRRTYRRRRILALALLLVGALVAWFLIAFFQPPPFDPGNGSGEAIVTVPEGASASDVADLLTENDVVSNGTLFEWRLKLAGKTGDILPGRYVLAHNMSYGTAIDRLTSSGGKINVTIPEGEDRTQIAATVKDLGLSGDYLAASKSSQGFDPNKYGAQNPKSLEGFLFPATYQLDPGSSVDQLVSEQLQAFRQNIAGREHVVREVEEPDDLRRPHHRLDDRQGGAGPLRAPAGRGGDLQPAAPGHAAGHRRDHAVRVPQLHRRHHRVPAQIPVAVQHANQRRPDTDADRQPGPRRDPGGGPPGEGQLHLLRAEGERERPALLHRERGGVQPAGGRLQRGPGARELPQLTAGEGEPEVKRLAVLGHPVSHSRSPAMQSAALEALGLGGRVELRGDRPGPRRVR